MAQRTLVLEHVDLSMAFRLARPRQVAAALKQLRSEAFACAEQIRAALQQQTPQWRAEYGQYARQWDLPR